MDQRDQLGRRPVDAPLVRRALSLWTIGTVLLIAAVFASVPEPAVAATSVQKMAEARSIKSQIDALDTRVSIADENYLKASAKHTKLLGEERRAAARAAKARQRLKALVVHLDTRANVMYRSGQLGFLDVLVGARSYEQFAQLWDVMRQMNETDAASISATKVARAEASAAEADLGVKERAAAGQVKVMASNRAYIETQLTQRKAKLAGVEAEVASLQAQEQAARVAAAARSVSYSGGSSDSYPTPSIPAHGNVVDYARSRLGLPYVWAATGPNSFDCSGLTMWAYAKVGISLPHYSQAQLDVGQRVSRKDLQPGDLVFFGSPIHHVGIFIGGGQMIEAPHSGANVRIGSIDRSDYAGASRP